MLEGVVAPFEYRAAKPVRWVCSDGETIEPGSKAHKRADSGVVVGNGARLRGLVEGWRWEDKQSFVLLCDSWRGSLLPLGGAAVVDRLLRSTWRPPLGRWMCLSGRHRGQALLPQGLGVVRESGDCRRFRT